MAQLPDPTIDLDWSGYVGSIQWHFGEVAKQHPDRLCVIETKSSEAPERTFTYKQIYEASNVLAHYLHDSGVGNGDVVMIWAHRSVDLVVGMMGALVYLPFIISIPLPLPIDVLTFSPLGFFGDTEYSRPSLSTSETEDLS
jgi:non-ribosomal peptide synthetase component F